MNENRKQADGQSVSLENKLKLRPVRIHTEIFTSNKIKNQTLYVTFIGFTVMVKVINRLKMDLFSTYFLRQFLSENPKWQAIEAIA